MKADKESIKEYITFICSIVALINGIFAIITFIRSEKRMFEIIFMIFCVLIFFYCFVLTFSYVKLRKSKKRDELCIKRIRDDLFSGRTVSDVIVNSFYEKGFEQPVILNKISININIDFNTYNDAYDIYYDWKIYGISKKKGILDEISLLIGGDYPSTDEELQLKSYLIDEKEKRELKTKIEGASRIKKITVLLSKFNIQEDMPFIVNFNYVWHKSFIKGDKNVFSFGKNLYFGKTHSPEMIININCNKIIYDPVVLEVRHIDKKSGKEENERITLEPKITSSESFYTIQLSRDEKERICFIEFEKD